MAKKKAEGPANYAEDKEFADSFMNDELEHFRAVSVARKERQEIWHESYQVWSANPNYISDGRNYQGRANLNLPQLRKEVETMSRRLVKALFPEDYLKADPSRIENTDLSIVNTQVVRHFYDNVSHIQSSLLPWMKQNVLYGTSPLRSYWKKEVNEMIYKKRVFKEDERGNLVPDFKRVKEQVTLYDAPKIVTADLFRTWVYPATATGPEDIQKVFYETEVDFAFLKEMEKQGLCINVDDLKDEGQEILPADEDTQRRLQAFGETAELRGKNEGKLYRMLETWGKKEIDGQMMSYVSVIINSRHCIRIQKNPYWHQTFPFDFGRFILAPNEFYGRGLPEASLAVQNQLNDVLNQGMDSASLSLNAITIINPAFAPNADSFEVEPNAIWWADPNAVKQMTFPDLSDSMAKNASMLRGIITEMSDNSPQLPDPIAGKARSTGQAQLAINEWQTDLYSFVNQVSIEALNPLTQKVHSMLQQFLPDDTIIRIAGKYAGNWINRVVTPTDIVGKFDFKWVGAIKIENEAVKTQQMLSFLKIYPMIPPGAKVKINWENLLIKLLRDGFNIKDVQNIIQSENLNASTPPNIENRLLDQGAIVAVNPADEDEAHLAEHLYGKTKTTDKYIMALYDSHMLKHKAQIEAKKAQAQMQQMQLQMQQQMMMAQAQSGQKKPTGQQGGANNPMGNQGQMNESTNEADMMRGMGT